jgi:hypothetical protein
MTQTAANEIVIRGSAADCAQSRLSDSLQRAVSGLEADDAAAARAQAEAAAPYPPFPAASVSGGLAGIKRTPGQSALFRLSGINSQAGATRLNMPGAR